MRATEEAFNVEHPNRPEAFESWWLDYYGPASQYRQDYDEQDEYFTRKHFALVGWLASVRCSST